MTRTIALKQIGTPRLVIRPLNEEDVPNIYGIIITEPDKYGFFKVRNNYNDEDELWCVIGDHGAPSLYRGSLVF